MIGQIPVIRPIMALTKSTLLLLMTAVLACGTTQPQAASSPQATEPPGPAGLVIGLDQNGRLEYFDPDTGKWSEAPTPTNIPTFDLKLGTGVNIATTARHNSNGAWRADCSGNICKIMHVENRGEEFSISRKHLLSPLHFSPDGDQFFFVKKSSRWRVPPRCHFEDEYDVYVRNVADKNARFVTTLCGGFPYQALRWYRLQPRTIRLKRR